MLTKAAFVILVVCCSVSAVWSMTIASKNPKSGSTNANLTDNGQRVQHVDNKTEINIKCALPGEECNKHEDCCLELCVFSGCIALFPGKGTTTLTVSSDPPQRRSPHFQQQDDKHH